MENALQTAISGHLQRYWPRVYADRLATTMAAVLPQDIHDGARRAEVSGLDLTSELAAYIAPLAPLWQMLHGVAILLAGAKGVEKAGARRAFRDGLYAQFRQQWPDRTSNRLAQSLTEILIDAAAGIEKSPIGRA